jgi:hypothetical protein
MSRELEFMKTVRPVDDLNVFILGARSHRVSIHTQQLRAVQLAADLSVDPKFKELSNAAVIGGGAAGVTLAVALALQKKTVYLYEQSSKLIPLQYYNNTRYVHPYAVNWPAKHYEPTTNLPFLNWYADYANPVSKRIYEKYLDIKANMTLPITEVRQAKVVECRAVGAANQRKSFEVKCESAAPMTFDAVFFTEGFGLERKLSAYDNHSYWEDSSLVPRRIKARPANVAVIGDGDGALIDLARCIFHTEDIEFIHDEMTRSLTQRDFREKIRSIETGLKFENGQPELPREYVEQFKEAVSRPEVNQLFNRLDRHNCKVTLVSTNEDGFSPNASPLNKLLYAYLRWQDDAPVNFVRMRAGSIEVVEDEDTNTFAYSITPDPDDRFRNDENLSQETLGPFDRVIERLGPTNFNSDLISSALDDDFDLDKFFQKNGEKFNFANPPAIEFAESELKKFSESSQRFNEGIEDLNDYVVDLLKGVIEPENGEIGYDTQNHQFTVKGVTLPQKRTPENFRDLRIRSRVEELPKYWYGKEVKVNEETIRRSPERTDRRYYNPIASSAWAMDLGEPLQDRLQPGQMVKLCDGSDDLSLNVQQLGCLSYFVRTNDSDEKYALMDCFRRTGPCFERGSALIWS